MPKRLTQQSFITRCIDCHGQLYDYSMVQYVNTTTKILIVCNIHGPFLQLPLDHVLKKCGCPKCKGAKIKQTKLEKYNNKNYNNIEKTKQTNLEKYGGHPKQTEKVQQKYKDTCLEKYGVEYPLINSQIKQKQQNTNLIKYGHINIAQGTKKEKIIQTNLEKYNTTHPWANLIIRDKIKKTMVEKYHVENPSQSVICKQRRLHTNLEKYGVGDYNQKRMVDIISLLQDPNWLTDQYIIQNKTAWHIAQELRISDGTIGNYLKKAEISIKKFHQSFISKLWLKSLNVDIIYEYQWDKNNLRTKADGYCQETNTIYEFHGDYWHGNPEIYSPEEIHPIIKKTMGELYRKTIEREERIKSLGYNLVVMWENDYKYVFIG